jgi:hypothetical protein
MFRTDRKIRLILASDIQRFTADGLELRDGSTLRAELVVLATGYKGLDHVVASRFGEAVAKHVTAATLRCRSTPSKRESLKNS